MKYKINSRNFHELLLRIKNLIDENENTIRELLSIDNKYCKMIVEIKGLKAILSGYNNIEIDDNTNKKAIIKINYNGNPYMTLNLGMIAIITNSTIILESEPKMTAINTFLVKLINMALREINASDLIFLAEDNEEVVDKIICIDDINKYNEYIRKGNKKARFYSMNYIDFYNDSDEFDDLEELIYQYADLNSFPIESYSELDHEEAINMLKKGLGKVVVVLTNNETLKNDIKNNITNKKIYINKNPFTQTMKLIDKEVLYI